MNKNQFFQGSELDKCLNMDYQKFDQDPAGWRRLAKKGEYENAVIEILFYLLKNKDQLNESEVVNLYFHAGQMFAFNNSYIQALDCFKRALLQKEDPDAPVKWNAYVEGTIAFLKKDLVMLTKCVDEVSRGSEVLSVIPNLDYLRNFVLHLDLPYREVYKMSTSNPQENCHK